MNQFLASMTEQAAEVNPLLIKSMVNKHSFTLFPWLFYPQPGPGPWSLLKKTMTPVTKAAGTGAFMDTPLASRTFFMRRYRVFLLGSTSQSQIDELQQQLPDWRKADRQTIEVQAGPGPAGTASFQRWAVTAPNCSGNYEILNFERYCQNSPRKGKIKWLVSFEGSCFGDYCYNQNSSNYLQLHRSRQWLFTPCPKNPRTTLKTQSNICLRLTI